MTSPEHELRVLVVAPTGRDGLLICNLLASKSISCVAISSAVTARIEAKMNAGAVILAEEALTLAGIDEWAELIAEQPSWSDLPVILLTDAGEVDRESQRKMRAREPLGNVVLLERPIRPETLVSTIQAALRSRHRQYQMRDYLAERHMVEEALRKSEKLAVAGRLAASMAHEINNPLNSVTNLLYLIGNSASLEESKRYGEIAAGELARVSELVTQTLRFYREPIRPIIVQVPEIIDSALVLYQARLRSAEILVERDFRECSPIVARAGELRQLILNLIGNAVDAIGQAGRLKIRVTNTREHRNGSRPGIRLTIADTGSGIHPEIRKSLFEPFVSTKGNTATGLGLWISSEIVRKHGGTIQVKSRALAPTTGTAFSVFLPLQPQAGGHDVPLSELHAKSFIRSGLC
jgi:signal transduction histidine kinase